jgi:hypothetical protein
MPVVNVLMWSCHVWMLDDMIIYVVGQGKNSRGRRGEIRFFIIIDKI